VGDPSYIARSDELKGTIMGHERKIKCSSCGKGVKKTGETTRIISFACPCGKTTYSRSKGL
jgi:predicted RNA-binding Zn-ribbon protein involved in translation (DUF1610 family)